MVRWSTGVTGLAVVLLAAGCTESLGPRPDAAHPPLPRFATTSPTGGIRLDKNILTFNERGRLLIKGFNPQNPHVGDAIVANFYWLGSTNIIDSVVDVLTTNPYTRVGNQYTLVQYVTAGGISMATYVATNVQNFPDASSDPSQILAVGAYLHDSVVDGGVRLSAWLGVQPVFAQALGSGAGAPRSASGSGTTPTVASTGAIAYNAGALVYGATLASPPVGVTHDTAFTDISSAASDNFMADDGVYKIGASAGTANPSWTWFFDQRPGGGTWLATALTLNAASAPPPPTRHRPKGDASLRSG